ncbi:MAG: hypothetical protein JSV84_03765 [Gemmatimonadota bacterium]|nr:MAG: hypothetical protein JSV84_03765 [Gemmatimonadota bacterium]
MNTIVLITIVITMVGLVGIGDISGDDSSFHVFTCCHDDGPGCVCFHDSGSWNPSGTWIQDVANMTLGTTESCENDGGKPYYQMRLGISDIGLAGFIACFLDAFGDPFGREAWCSETISYWHKRKGIPYSTGYRNSSWNLDWQLTSTSAIRSFYEAEEQLPNGRGRWIDHTDPDYLDYDDFRPGENFPVPGSYVFIQQYIQTGPSSGAWLGCNHSLMIDSMFVYREYFPLNIVRVKITFLEGNTGPEFQGTVKNTRTVEDIFQATPAGTSFVSYCEGDTVRKIRGFGIDLDSDGDPIYDTDRLKYLASSYEAPEFDPWPDDIADPEWDLNYAELIPQLVNYTKILGGPGPKVTSSSEWVEMPDYPHPRIPDGVDVRWVFPSTLDRYEPDGVFVEIDLVEDHPLPVKGIVLGWNSEFIPDGYSLRWASAGGRYNEAPVPTLAGMAPPDDPGIVPVPIMFHNPGVSVRYVLLLFPYNTFADTASLEEIRFLYDWGPDTDATSNSLVGACCLPDGRCMTVTERMCDTYGGAYQGDDVPCLGDADGNEVDDRCEGSGLLKCDINADGAINIIDVMAVINHILDIQPLGRNIIVRADCNGDGTIYILDVLGCVNVILGLGECGP